MTVRGSAGNRASCGAGRLRLGSRKRCPEAQPRAHIPAGQPARSRQLLSRQDVAQRKDADAHLRGVGRRGRARGRSRHSVKACAGAAGAGAQTRGLQLAARRARAGSQPARQPASGQPAALFTPRHPAAAPGASHPPAPTSLLPASCHFCVSQLGSQELLSRRATLPLERASMMRPAAAVGARREGGDAREPVPAGHCCACCR